MQISRQRFYLLAGPIILGAFLFFYRADFFRAGERDRSAPLPVVVILPHQDDEMFLAGSLTRYVRQGHPVFVALATDGAGSFVRHTLNGVDEHGSAVFCDYHKRRHNPREEGYTSLSREAFTAARDKEFLDSLGWLGIPRTRVFFMEDDGDETAGNGRRYADGHLTSDEANRTVRALYERWGAGIYLTLAGGHADHAQLERAVAKLPDTAQKFFYPLGPLENTEMVTLSSFEQTTKQQALATYRRWDPERGRFAVGAHSVSDMLDAYAAAPTEYRFRLP